MTWRCSKPLGGALPCTAKALLQKSRGIVKAMCEEGAGYHTLEAASRMILDHLEILELRPPQVGWVRWVLCDLI